MKLIANAGVAVIQATKGRATSGTTTVARGGFAAAMGKDDSPELHLQDILMIVHAPGANHAIITFK
jgi:aspartate oxidase